MAKVRATIVHISDLHFGRTLNERLATQLKGLIKDIQLPEPPEPPKFLVVSGDLVNHPFPWSLRRACKYITDIGRDNNIPPKRILVVPGNHDYKLWGNVGLGLLSRIPFEVYFKHDGLKIGFWRRSWMYLRLTLRALSRLLPFLRSEV